MRVPPRSRGQLGQAPRNEAVSVRQGTNLASADIDAYGRSLGGEAASSHSSRPRAVDRGAALRPGEEQGEGRVYRERAQVRVYDLGQTFVTRGVLNRMAKSYGAFHTGVEVYGREWSFGMTFDDYSTGVTWNPPGQNSDHTFRETLSMGYTTLSPGQVLKLIEHLKVEWMGCTYQLLTRNCHHFSDEFCRHLGVSGIPPWVNTLAETGASTANFLDSADSGYDGGEAIFDFFRGVRRRFSSLMLQDDEAEAAHWQEEHPGRLPKSRRGLPDAGLEAALRGQDNPSVARPDQRDPHAMLRAV